MRLAIAAAVLALSQSWTPAQPVRVMAPRFIRIANPGFEQTSRPLAVGEITNGCGGALVPVGTRPSFWGLPQFEDTVVVPGWRTRLPPPNNPDITVYAGVVSPPEVSPGQPYITGYSGAHAATLHHVPMQQTLPVLIRPGTRYRLSFKAGFGVGDTAEGVYMALLAAPDLATPVYVQEPGVPVLAQTQGLHVPIESEGQMREYELVATTPAVLPPELQGKLLAISFIGSDGIPKMTYDDFRLEQAPATTPTPP